MPMSVPAAQATGGLTPAAFARDRSAMTEAAREAQFEQFREQIRAALPELDPVADAEEIDRRAKLGQCAQLIRMSDEDAEASTLQAQSDDVHGPESPAAGDDDWAAALASWGMTARYCVILLAERTDPVALLVLAWWLSRH